MGGAAWITIGFAVAEVGPVQGSELSLSAFRLEFQV